MVPPTGRTRGATFCAVATVAIDRAATVVTSNRDTAEWLTTFDDSLLAQSAIDRFQNAAYDLVIESESYRPRLKPTIDKAGPPPERPVEKRPLYPRQKRRR